MFIKHTHQLQELVRVRFESNQEVVVYNNIRFCTMFYPSVDHFYFNSAKYSGESATKSGIALFFLLGVVEHR